MYSSRVLICDSYGISLTISDLRLSGSINRYSPLPVNRVKIENFPKLFLEINTATNCPYLSFPKSNLISILKWQRLNSKSLLIVVTNASTDTALIPHSSSSDRNYSSCSQTMQGLEFAGIFALFSHPWLLIVHNCSLFFWFLWRNYWIWTQVDHRYI